MSETLEAINARAEALVVEHRELLQGLIALREANRLSQEQVAERMGVSQSAVSQFERYDSNPKLSTIRRYALAVGARIHHRVENEYLSVKTSPVMIPRPAAHESAVNWGSSRLEMGCV